MAFLTSIFQSLLASAIYSIGSSVIKCLVNYTPLVKRYEDAFERAIRHFYADPKYAGNEARHHYDDYIRMLQDASISEDILNSSNHVYEQMFHLFVQEVSKDKFLQGYTTLKNIFTTQKKLEEINKSIQKSIELAQVNRSESKLEHNNILKHISRLEDLITNPLIQNITIAPLSGSVAMQSVNETHIVPREQLIEKCIRALDEGRLVILYGALKVGKTTLAQLVAKKKNEVEIIDNIPKQDLEAYVLNLLSNHKNEKIIVTTASALNKNLSTVNFSLIEQIEIPLLSVAETTALINTYNPVCNLDSFIYGHTGGHPVLVKTLCSYLSTCNWKFDEDKFSHILNYSFDHDLTRALSDLISNIITDSETRILLNRLLLVNGPFTEIVACQLAEVIPQIEEARRRLYSLIPTWITYNNNNFNISPLLSKLWHADISDECQKQCYIILAQNILNSKKPLNEYDILNYINYSVRAKEYDNAGYMYIAVLNKLHDSQYTLPEKSLLRSIWIDLPLPVDMSIKIKIGCRISQLLLLGNLSQKCRNYLLWDLKQLVESYKEDDFKAFFYLVISLICWQEDDITDGLRYNNIYNTLDKKATEDIVPLLEDTPSLFDNNIWIFLLRLKTVEEYETWLETFRTSSVNYSHEDNEICNCCYLSISRLITYYLKDSDSTTKQDILFRIRDKAEQCKCPEIAISCLYKILDIYAGSGLYEAAKTLYIKYYEQYKSYPLAVILLNGAMVFVCYKTKQPLENSLLYFELVAQSQNKNLIPDIQLHTKEILAYINAEYEPEQSVKFLNEALEYASDERHRTDIFEYYQCKGELSYAYWCIGKRFKAVELLSDCVDFVLPLAEAEKDFAKTYLCLCNCLINQYSVDIQGKSLPADQASPVHGMFTENSLMFLDELYSTDRLYITCYQMSDLCVQLQNNDLAYKWAKKAIEACRKNGEVKNFHYLLFQLIPLLKADIDLNDIGFVIKHVDKARRIVDQLHPENKDIEFVEFQIIPLLMEALTLKIKGNAEGIELIKNILKDYEAITDRETITYIKWIFDQKTYNKDFIAEINKLSVSKYYTVHVCAYIITAYYSSSDYAFDLLISSIPELQKQLVKIYGFKIIAIFNRFISTYWKMKIFKNPEEFKNYEHLKDGGVKLINEYDGKLEQANKTMMVISYHLKQEHKMNNTQEDWLYMSY